MAKLFILTILLISFSLSAAAQAKLDSFVTKYNIETDHVLTYAGDGPYADEAIETVQADKWKAGYVIAYTSYERKSYFFFTDEKFKKTSNEIELKDRIIEKVVTDNEELVFLTRNRIDFENRIISNTIYFTKISEKGEVELDVKIIGSENMAKAGESKLSDRATPQLAWTGMYYFAYFGINHNYSKNNIPDEHQGDCAYFIKPDGSMYTYDDWGVSHSFEQRIAISDKNVVMVAKGDAYPRGMRVNHVSLTHYKMETYKGDSDRNIPHIKQYYSPNDENGKYECDAFLSSGEEGDNYLPFALGDVVIREDDAAVVSCSFKDNRVMHDVGLLIIKPEAKNCSSGLKFLTDTELLCEHSVRMAPLNNKEILIFWKEVNLDESDVEIDDLQEEILNEEEGDVYLQTWTKYNFDTNKMAIIDYEGNYITKPQSSRLVDWYYTISRWEDLSEWHDVIDEFAQHTYSPIIEGQNKELVWCHHKHAAKVINVYSFKK